MVDNVRALKEGQFPILPEGYDMPAGLVAAPANTNASIAGHFHDPRQVRRFAGRATSDADASCGPRNGSLEDDGGPNASSGCGGERMHDRIPAGSIIIAIIYIDNLSVSINWKPAAGTRRYLLFLAKSLQQ
jgi:hypothetical protein